MRPGIGYALAKAVEEGHCGSPVSHLLRLTADLIEVPAALIETALALELGAGETIADTVGGQSYVFLAGSIMPSKGIVLLWRFGGSSPPLRLCVTSGSESPRRIMVLSAVDVCRRMMVSEALAS